MSDTQFSIMLTLATMCFLGYAWFENLREKRQSRSDDLRRELDHEYRMALLGGRDDDDDEDNSDEPEPSPDREFFTVSNT